MKRLKKWLLSGIALPVIAICGCPQGQEILDMVLDFLGTLENGTA